MWYKKNGMSSFITSLELDLRGTEQPFRVGIWFGTGGLSIIIGSLASFGLQHYERELFTSRQIMFLVCGMATVFVGLLVLLFLPDNPMSSGLSTKEKLQAIERLRSNKTGVENKNFESSQMMEAFRDPHVWVIVVLMITSSEINGALSNYQASIIKS
jgi:sugar phosphate permease